MLEAMEVLEVMAALADMEVRVELYRVDMEFLVDTVSLVDMVYPEDMPLLELHLRLLEGMDPWLDYPKLKLLQLLAKPCQEDKVS